MLVQASIAGQQILSRGFSMQVVAPVTDDDVAQVAQIEHAITHSWQNFTQYGDSAHARVQTLVALRTLLAPTAGLTDK